MSYNLLKFFHILGAILMGAGLVAVWLADMRSRQLRELSTFAEAVRTIAVCYDGLVVPGSLLLLVSGAWMIAQYYGGLNFLQIPWLVGMVALFLVEFIEGNTVTRLYFMRLRRLTRQSLQVGRFTAELEHERGKLVPSFTHFLDLPILTLIIALGALKPDTWSLWWVGVITALAISSLLTYWIPRMYPWGAQSSS
jgi:hypothetical protein